MQFSRTSRRVLFGLLLVLSVGVKLVLGAATPGYRDELAAGRRAIAVFLGHHDFRTEEYEGQPESPFVLATKGECRLLAAVLASDGSRRDMIRQLASEDDRIFFVVDGHVYEDQPKWRTGIIDRLRRLQLFAGRWSLARPIGVVASPECDTGNLAWGELAEVR